MPSSQTARVASVTDQMKATSYQKKTTKRWIILLLLLLVVALIIGVSIKASRKNAT